MERLDVTFANRYLDAVARHRAGRETTRAWGVAFAALGRWPPIVIQHQMLGMNAHINLDPGIAAAETRGTVDLAVLRDTTSSSSMTSWLASSTRSSATWQTSGLSCDSSISRPAGVTNWLRGSGWRWRESERGPWQKTWLRCQLRSGRRRSIVAIAPSRPSAAPCCARAPYCVRPSC